MKKTLVVVGHPHLEKSVVSKHWLEAITGKATLRFLAEVAPLDKPLDIAAEQAVLEQHDRIILQFPLYWYSAPALMKRWLDEIMTFGWAYGQGGDKLAGKELGIAVSAGGAEVEFSSTGYQLYTLEEFMQQYEAVAAFVRMKWIGMHAIYDTYGADLIDRLPQNSQQYLKFITQ